MPSALSTIQDVDMGSEMTTMTQQQVLQQGVTAMLAQPRNAPPHAQPAVRSALARFREVPFQFRLGRQSDHAGGQW
jgi:hypothetical protein